MLTSWRLRAVATVVSLLVTAGVASAQSVVARNVAAGSSVELVLNATPAGTATADALGDARLPFTLTQLGAKDEIDASVAVDTCADRVRIVVVERGQTAAAPDTGCTRRDVLGLFLVRRVTNLVVDTQPVTPTVWLRQGPVDLTRREPTDRWSSTPRGLILFAGAGLGSYRDALLLQCGNVSPCEGGDSRTTYTAGATLWLGRFIGVEGAYLKPAGVNANGTATNFRFNSVFSSQLAIVNGKVGLPLGRVRIYGQGGTNYHRATLTTTETIDDATVTINGVVQPISGGTQTIDFKSGGWGWQVGAGLEVWFSSSVGIFGEVGRTRVSGDGIDGSRGETEDYLTSALFGVRFKLGR